MSTTRRRVWTAAAVSLALHCTGASAVVIDSFDEGGFALVYNAFPAYLTTTGV